MKKKDEVILGESPCTYNVCAACKRYPAQYNVVIVCTLVSTVSILLSGRPFPGSGLLFIK